MLHHHWLIYITKALNVPVTLFLISSTWYSPLAIHVQGACLSQFSLRWTTAELDFENPWFKLTPPLVFAPPLEGDCWPKWLLLLTVPYQTQTHLHAVSHYIWVAQHSLPPPNPTHVYLKPFLFDHDTAESLYVKVCVANSNSSGRGE